MDWIQALILGIVQGLTEFLPVSSSGHLEIGKAILGANVEESLTFTVVVHGATVLSTIIVFRNDILQLIKGLFAFKWNEETQYVAKIALSMVPVLLVGIFLKEEVEQLFTGDILMVGSMLLITACLLAITYYAKAKERPITFLDALVIGIAQAIAVIPGISRSGSTIVTGLMLGNKKSEIARFSFLMVLVPILGANFLDLIDSDLQSTASIGVLPLVVGFIAAFISGLMACTLMINIVKKGNLLYFALYCFIIGSIAIIWRLFLS